MPKPEPSLSKSALDHLQQVGSETEETGNTGTRQLVGGTMEGRAGGGCLGRDDWANGGTSWRGGSWSAGLGWLGCGDDGSRERHCSGGGEGTLGHSDGLAGGGSVSTDRGWLGDGDGLAGRGRGVGDCAWGADNHGEGGWAWANSDVGAWCGYGQCSGAWADGGRGGHEGCGDGQASSGDCNTGSVDHALSLCAWAAFGNGEGLRLRQRLVGDSKAISSRIHIPQ